MERRMKFSFLIRLAKKLQANDIFASSAQLSYYLILAFFPFMIFVFTLIGYLNLDSSLLTDGFDMVFPNTVNTLIVSTLEQIINVKNGELFWLSLAAVTVAASTGFRGVIKAANKAYGMKETRPFPLVWIISIFNTITLTVSIIVIMVLLVFGNFIGVFLANQISWIDYNLDFWRYFRHIFSLVSVIIFYTAIYKYTPSQKLKWKEVSVGAIFSSISWITVSLIFSSYMNSTNKLSVLYGGLAAVFGLIMWLYMTSFIFILGMEINSVFFVKRKSNEFIIGMSKKNA